MHTDADMDGNAVDSQKGSVIEVENMDRSMSNIEATNTAPLDVAHESGEVKLTIIEEKKEDTVDDLVDQPSKDEEVTENMVTTQAATHAMTSPKDTATEGFSAGPNIKAGAGSNPEDGAEEPGNGEALKELTAQNREKKPTNQTLGQIDEDKEEENGEEKRSQLLDKPKSRPQSAVKDDESLLAIGTHGNASNDDDKEAA